MTTDEKDQTIAFQANQLRMLSKQYAETLAAFQTEHGQIVGKLNEQLQAKTVEVERFKVQVELLTSRLQRELEARTGLSVPPVAPDPIPVGEVLEGSAAD